MKWQAPPQSTRYVRPIRLAHVENLPQRNSAERAFIKLARNFAAQMEALKKPAR